MIKVEPGADKRERKAAESRTDVKGKRPLLLWLFCLWLLALSASGLWRAAALWQTRELLAELESSLSPVPAALLSAMWLLCGAALAASAVGLWLRREWGRRTARASIVAYYALQQAYLWLFVRTGLLWERRWVMLATAIVAVSIGVGALSWPRSQRWLGLRDASSLSKRPRSEGQSVKVDINDIG